MTKRYFYFFLSIFFICLFPSAHAEKIMMLSDIHFNPFNSCTTATPCPTIEALRQAHVSQWETLLSQYDTKTPAYGADTGYLLFKSTLAELQQRANAADAVVILGDFLSHDYKILFEKYSSDASSEAYQAFVQKTYEYITQSLTQTFSKIPVYSLIGNNDSYDDDYGTDLNTRFRFDLADLWSPLLKNKLNQSKMHQQLNSQGYYAVPLLPSRDIILIALDSNYFSAKVISTPEQDTAAKRQLQFLNDQLIAAEKLHKKAMIAMHIPDAVDVYKTLKSNPTQVIPMWRSEYSAQFQAILQQHATTVAGVFVGHSHADGFQVLPSNVVVNSIPAISPMFGNNPGYKIYDYAAATGFSDYTTYYSLPSPANWKVEYRFNQTYQANCTSCQLINGMNALQTTGNLADAYKLYYGVNTNSQPITKTNQWLPYYWCMVHHADAASYQTCLSGSP